MSLLARFLETDPKMSTDLQQLQGRLDGDNTLVETLRELVAQLIHVVENQQTMIEEQRRKIDELSNVSIHSVITTHDLSKRVLELERYSRKQCLILDSIEVGRDQGLTTALNLLNNHLRININRQDIMACHPLGPSEVAPVIVKFVYYHHMDTTWARKGHLRGLWNSLRRYIYLRECLAQHDREIMMEAKNLNIRTITKNQEVSAVNPNKDEKVPPYKINHMNELHRLANKFVRIVEEEMVEEPANVIVGDNISTLSLPELSKKTRIASFWEATTKT